MDGQTSESSTPGTEKLSPRSRGKLALPLQQIGLQVPRSTSARKNKIPVGVGGVQSGVGRTSGRSTSASNETEGRWLEEVAILRELLSEEARKHELRHQEVLGQLSAMSTYGFLQAGIIAGQEDERPPKPTRVWRSMSRGEDTRSPSPPPPLRGFPSSPPTPDVPRRAPSKCSNSPGGAVALPGCESADTLAVLREGLAVADEALGGPTEEDFTVDLDKPTGNMQSPESGALQKITTSGTSSTFGVRQSPEFFHERADLKAYLDNGGRKGLVSRALTSVRKSRTGLGFSSRSHFFRRHHSSVNGFSTCTIHPDSSLRFLLDASSLVMLLADLVLVPYQLAWDIPFQGWLQAWTWTTLVYWTLDLGLGFFSGFYKEGHVHLELADTCSQYMKTAFTLNAIAVFCDLAGLVLAYKLDESLQSTTWVGKLPRMLKFHRLVRIAALFNAGRLARFYAMVEDFSVSCGMENGFHASEGVFKILLLLAWLNHLGACIWHIVGVGSAYPMYFREIGREDAEDLSFFNYVVSFLQSTSTLLAGETQMVLTNTQEKITLIMFILVGLITGSLTTGYITDTLVAYRLTHKEHTDQLRMLRKLLNQAKVPFGVCSNLEREVATARKSQKRVLESEVVLLKNLSPESKVMLDTFAFGKAICVNTFANTCHLISPTFLELICSQAMAHTVVESGTVVFRPGDEAEGAYMVFWGRYSYAASSLSNNRDNVHGSHSSVLTPGEGQTSNDTDNVSSRHVKLCRWICELALYCHVKHVDSMRAMWRSEHLIIHGKAFADVLRSDQRLCQLARRYSSAVMEAVSRQSEQSPHVSPMSLPLHHESLLPLLPEADRVKMSQAALLELQILSGAPPPKLVGEVSNGECDLVVTTRLPSWDANLDTAVHRVVSLVVLRLVDDDGKVLCQIGKRRNGECTAQLQLPGIKVGHGELPRDALGSLLEGNLKELGDQIQVGNVEVQEEVKDSSSYHIRTKYIRSVYHARLSSGREYATRKLRVSTAPASAMRAASMHPAKVARATTGYFGRAAGAQLHKPMQARRVKAVPSGSTAASKAQQDMLDPFLMGQFGSAGKDSEAIFAWLMPWEIDMKEARDAAETSLKVWVPFLSLTAFPGRD